MAKMEYTPKYAVSGRAMNLIAEITAAVERYRIVMEGPDGIRLRKINHVRTIRGTTAIEGNTLTEEEITCGRISRSIMRPFVSRVAKRDAGRSSTSCLIREELAQEGLQ